MLDGGDQHFIAGLDVLPAPRAGHEVDALRRAAGEDDLLLAAGIDESLHRAARLFVGRGGHLAQVMHAAMHVRVFLGVVANDAIDHRLRLLRRRRVVQVDERLAPADGSVKDGEVFSNTLNVVSRGPWSTVRGPRLDCRHGVSLRSGSLPGIWRKMARRICSRTGSTFIRSTISLAKAEMRRLRACASPIPRA